MPHVEELVSRPAQPATLKSGATTVLRIDILGDTVDDPRARIYSTTAGGVTPYLPLSVTERLLRLVGRASKQLHVLPAQLIGWIFLGIAAPERKENMPSWLQEASREMESTVDELVASWEEKMATGRSFLPPADMGIFAVVCATCPPDDGEGDDGALLDDVLMGLMPSAEQHIGQCVELHSLQGRADLNGQSGVVQLHDEQSGRAGVLVAGSTIAVQCRNLRLVAPAPPGAAGTSRSTDDDDDFVDEPDEEEQEVPPLTIEPEVSSG